MWLIGVINAKLSIFGPRGQCRSIPSQAKSIFCQVDGMVWSTLQFTWVPIHPDLDVLCLQRWRRQQTDKHITLPLDTALSSADAHGVIITCCKGYCIIGVHVSFKWQFFLNNSQIKPYESFQLCKDNLFTAVLYWVQVTIGILTLACGSWGAKVISYIISSISM